MGRPRTTALVLRVCNADMTSSHGFTWPTKGVAKAPDWKKKPECGNGLHGWLYGAGDHSCATIKPDSKWLVVKVLIKDVVTLGEKCKFPQGTVQHVGDQLSATTYLLEHEPKSASLAVIGASLKIGDDANGQVGDLGSLLAGHRSTLTGGHRSTLTGGYGSTLTGGHRSTLTGGHRSTLTGGYGSTLTGGDGSTLQFKYWDSAHDRYRIVTVYPGENGVKVNTKYRLNDAHKLEEVK